MRAKPNDSFLEERIQKYDKWLKRGDISYSSRVIPIRESFEPKQWVMPSEQVLEILRNAQSIALTHCICRTHYARCDNPREVCFNIDEVADKGIAEGKARRISMEEAEEVLRVANEKGLIHLSFYLPGQKMFALCSCCNCCCHDLQIMNSYGRKDLIAYSEYVAETDMDMCTHCGDCIDRCAFVARRWEGDEMVYSPEACYGCGLCVTTCPTEATAIRRREA